MAASKVQEKSILLVDVALMVDETYVAGEYFLDQP